MVLGDSACIFTAVVTAPWLPDLTLSCIIVRFLQVSYLKVSWRFNEVLIGSWGAFENRAAMKYGSEAVSAFAARGQLFPADALASPRQQLHGVTVWAATRCIPMQPLVYFPEDTTFSFQKFTLVSVPKSQLLVKIIGLCLLATKPAHLLPWSPEAQPALSAPSPAKRVCTSRTCVQVRLSTALHGLPCGLDVVLASGQTPHPFCSLQVSGEKCVWGAFCMNVDIFLIWGLRLTVGGQAGRFLQSLEPAVLVLDVVSVVPGPQNMSSIWKLLLLLGLSPLHFLSSIFILIDHMLDLLDLLSFLFFHIFVFLFSYPREFSELLKLPSVWVLF